MIEYLKRMSRYNQWMNRKLYDKVQQLSAEAIGEYRGAFFGSILGTLNHIMVTDLLWLPWTISPCRPRCAISSMTISISLPTVVEHWISLSEKGVTS